MDEINLFTYENWRDVVGYEGLYEVSTLGRVRSLDRLVKGKCGSMQLKKGRILKLGLDKDGYQQVCLCKNGKKKPHKVHRIVANAFIPNPLQLPQVNHLDEDKTNNMVENLEWCTNEYNHNYGTINERIAKAKKGKPNIGASLALSKRVAQINPQTDEVIKIWQSTAECGRNGYNQGNISQCCRNCYHDSNIYKSFKWQYVNDSFYAMQNCSTIDFPNLDEEVII